MTVSAVSRRSKYLQKLAQYYNQNKGKMVAFFCMEYGLRRDLPIYSGGLGVLAGDWLKAAAQMKDPLFGLGILYRSGFFRQEIGDGRQISHPHQWEPEKHPDLIDLGTAIEVEIAGRKVSLREWAMNVGSGDNFLPLHFLDSRGFPNPVGFEEITDRLYPSDVSLRLYQEMVLGIGGMRILAKYGLPAYYHLNEGHAAFATVEFMNQVIRKEYCNLSQEDYEAVRQRFSFTTHTPVPAGFDSFHVALIRSAFSERFLQEAVLGLGRDPKNFDYVNMAYLAMQLSGVRNGVSQLHAQNSEGMFPEFRPIIGITNGVDHLTWTSDHLARLYDKYCSGWREDPRRLKLIGKLEASEGFREELWKAHQHCKEELFKYVRESSGVELDPNVFTIGFARRFADYKRGNLIFENPEELLRTAEEKGGLQIIIAGKAHPADSIGQGILADAIRKGKELTQRSDGKIKVVFLENYDLDIGKLMVSGSDVWLNNPLPPNEASGTSGMKAAMNGVPQISTWDGWWVEGSREDATGWTIGKDAKADPEDAFLYKEHSAALYRVIHEVMEAYRNRQTDPTFMNKMINAIAENASFFNTVRMNAEYREKVWSPVRILHSKPPEIEIEPVLPPQLKLIMLNEIIYQLARTDSRSEVNDLTARAIIGNLRRCFRVRRYEIHDESVRIDQSWLGGEFGRHIIKETRADFGKSKFINWRKSEDFKDEVIADLLKQGKIQVVTDPKNDRRCYRNGQLVSENPFILVPEIVNGVIMGAWKIDFRPGEKLGAAYEIEFLESLLRFVGMAKEEILQSELEKDLGQFKNEGRLINWVLTLMTAGGFTSMPRYAVETNRVAFFENTPEGLVGRLGIGETTLAEHHLKIGDLSKSIYSERVEEILRNYDPSTSALNGRVKGKNVGQNAVLGPVFVQYEVPIFNPEDFKGGFDGRRFRDQKKTIEDLFKIEGKVVDEYLLLPVFGEEGEFLGLVYVDNAFSGKPLSPEKYRNLVSAFGKHLSMLKKEVENW